MKHLTDKDLKELRRIHESVPQELKDRLTLERKVTPTMSNFVKKALKEDLPEAKKEMLRNIQKSGILEQKEVVVNRSAERAVDQHITAEIIKAVRAGRLSKPPEGTELHKYFKNNG
jgi:hypothetical protein